MILNKLREYVDPTDLEIHIYKNGIYVVNYTLISNFSDNKIEIKGKDDKVFIVGKNLVISRLQKEELYICGNIYEVILR